MTRQEWEIAQSQHPDNISNSPLSRDEITDAHFNNPDQSPTYSSVESLERNIPAVLGSYGRDLINTPRNLLNLAPGINSQNNPIPAYEPNFDYYKAMGVQQGLPQSIAEGALNFMAPLGIAKGVGTLGKLPLISKGLQTNLLAAGLAGETSDPNNPYTGLGEGAAIGGAAHGLGLGASALANGAANLYAKSSLPGLVSRGTKFVKQSLSDADTSAAPLKAAHDDAVANENLQWNDTDNKAQQLDASLMRPNPAPYLDYVNNYIKDKSALEPAIRNKSEEAIDFAKNNALALTPQSYQGAVALRQGLNENINDYLRQRNKDMPSRELNNFVTGLKSTLDDVANPPDSPPAVQDFANSWDAANQATQRKRQFYLTPNKNGVLESDPELEKALKGNNVDSSVIKNFIPAKDQTGTAGIDHLTNLVGDQSTAQDMVNSYNMRELVGSGKSNKSASDFYSKLSPSQRDALFSGTKAEPFLSTANDVMLNYDKPMPNAWYSPRTLSALAAYHAIPGAAAGLGAHYSGLTPWDSVGVGLGAMGGAGALKYGMRYVSPASVQKYMAYGNTTARNPGIIANPLLNSINYGIKNG